MATPGIHSKFEWDHYSGEERRVITRLSEEWYITSSTKPVNISDKSVYRAFLCKANDATQQLFHLDLEIIALFSSYPEFDARSIDGFEAAAERWEKLRPDPICKILISKDPNIAAKVRNLLKNDPELPIIVPFTYQELETNRGDHFIRNRFRDHFFSRDLFAFESPLKRDTFFFGRTPIVRNILSRHKSNENSALFGLRRSGKTSIVYGLERAARLERQIFVSIDCQSPSVHGRRWNELLFYILTQVRLKYNLKKSLIDETRYGVIEAADAFYGDIKKLYGALDDSAIMISFDEIEQISPGTATSSHWNEDHDFVLFWQSVRSAFQRHTGVFSFLLIGTNPKCVEAHLINGRDNPIFNSVPISYIPGFDELQTKEMVRKLGSYMGLNFQETIYARLHDDFGGHPYLIRHLCSILNSNAPTIRPVTVDKLLYEKAKGQFLDHYANYTEMILDVLVRHFQDEFVMLSALACGDVRMFDGFATDPTLTNHLMGYGLIDRGAQGYYFKIESVRDHLRKKQRFTSPLKTNTERLAEVSARVALLEPALRRFVSVIILSKNGKQSIDVALKYVQGATSKRLRDNGFKETFLPTSIDTNFSDLIKIIGGEWDAFKNMLTLEKSEFEFYAEQIRKGRTQAAHSGDIKPADFDLIRIAFSKIEGELEDGGFLGPLPA